MKKEERLKYLKKLATSNEGQALKEHFEELINNLTDGRNFAKENFEIEGKASLKAAAIIEKIMRDLKLLGRQKKKKEKNPYI